MIEFVWIAEIPHIYIFHYTTDCISQLKLFIDFDLICTILDWVRLLLLFHRMIRLVLISKLIARTLSQTPARHKLSSARFGKDSSKTLLKTELSGCGKMIFLLCEGDLTKPVLTNKSSANGDKWFIEIWKYILVWLSYLNVVCYLSLT